MNGGAGRAATPDPAQPEMTLVTVFTASYCGERCSALYWQTLSHSYTFLAVIVTQQHQSYSWLQKCRRYSDGNILSPNQT